MKQRTRGIFIPEPSETVAEAFLHSGKELAPAKVPSYSFAFRTMCFCYRVTVSSSANFPQ